MPSRSDLEFINDILHAIEKILEYIGDREFESFMNDPMLQDAVIRNIEVIGEATKNISNKFKSEHSDIQWKDIAKTRDKVSHQYFGVDYEIVWGIIKNDLLPLSRSIRDMIHTYDPSI